MNENGFNVGGKIKVAKTGKVNKQDIEQASESQLRDLLKNPDLNTSSRSAIAKRLEKNKKGGLPTAFLKDGVVGGLFLQSSGPTSATFSKAVDKGVELPGKLRSARKIEGNIYTGVLDKKANQSVRSSLSPALEQGINTAAEKTMRSLEIKPLDIDEKSAAKRAVKKIDLASIEGFIFEAFISAMSGLNLSDPGATFDFPNISNLGRKRLANIFGPDPISGRLIDAKRTLDRGSIQNSKSSIANKILSATRSGQISDSDFVVRRNKGGGVSGQDTVPALLTPGEFVFNKKAAQSIGYGNLNRMNKQGVQGFNSGGTVGFRRYANGTAGAGATGLPGGSSAGLGLLQSLKAIEAETKKYEDRLKAAGNTQKNVEKATKAFNNQLKKGLTVAKAREKVDKALTKTIQKQAAERQKGGGGGGRGGAAAGLQGIGQSLQQVAFFASIVGTTAVQMAGLNEATERAANQTIAETAAIAGIGGVLADLGSQALLAAQNSKLLAIAQGRQIAASNASAAADGTEAAASLAAAGPMIALAAVILIAVAAFQIWRFAAKKSAEEAKEFGKSASSAAKQLREFGQLGSAGTLRASLEKQQAKNIESANTSLKGWASLLFTLTNPLLGLIDAVVFAFTGFSLVGSAVDGLLKVFPQLGPKVVEIGNTVDSFIALASSSAQLKKTFDKINENKFLTEEEKQTGRLKTLESSGVPNLATKASEDGFNKLKEVSEATGVSLNKLLASSEESVGELVPPGARAATEQALRNVKASGEELKSFEKKAKESFDFFAQKAVESGDFGEQLKDPTSKVARSLAVYRQSIIASKKAEIERLKASQVGISVFSDESKAIQQTINSLNTELQDLETKGLNSELANTVEAADKQSEITKQVIEAQEKEIIARNNLIKSIKAQQQADAITRNYIKGLQKQSEATEDFIARLNNELPKLRFEAPDLGEDRTIGEITTNLTEFKNGIQNLPKAIADNGRKAADSLLTARKFISESAEKIAKGEEVSTADVERIFGKGQGEAFAAALQEASKKGSITIEEATALFDQFNPKLEQYQNTIDTVAEAEKKRLSLIEQTIEKENAIRNKSIERVGKFNDATSKAAEILARARGESGARTRARQETAAAQRSLDAGQRFRAGLRKINSIPDPGQRLKVENKLRNTIKDVNKELERLANSTSKVAVLEEKLAAAQKSREQQFKILEEFVVGGEKERQALVSSFQGLKAAVATGTTQNQTEESRKATFGLLDKLSDVLIQGTGGLTGREVKQELIFRDAVRLGFPPEIAKELATSTSTEEKILQAIIRQTRIIEASGVALARSSGGPIYRADGGSIFQPRGTDTVPAMLTPGEYVLRRSAVNKIGVGTLNALNNGNAQALYRQAGGPVNAANAIVGGGNIAFPSAAQVIDIIAGQISRLPYKDFIKTLRESGVQLGADDKRDLQLLARTGNFDPRRFVKGRLQKIRQFGNIQGIKGDLTKFFDVFNRDQVITNKLLKDKDVKEGVQGILPKLKAVRDAFQGGGKGLNTFYEQATGSTFSKGVNQAGRIIEQGVLKDGGLNKGILLGKDKQAERVVAKNRRQQDNIIQAIQNLKGKGLYLNSGGAVGADRVPAMLTPGEFIMSPEAVSRHGIGFMNQLNRGKIPGFRKGGVVGGVQYRQDGGVVNSGGLIIDPSRLQSTLDTFSQEFGESLTNVVNSFSTFSQNITSLTNALSQGMTVNHNFTGDMTLAFKIENGDALKNAVGEAITPKIQELVSGEINRRIDELKNGTAG